eukprot:scaffold2627_cov421-Prasinococcus_capsulatus_cf.AAC.2
MYPAPPVTRMFLLRSLSCLELPAPMAHAAISHAHLSQGLRTVSDWVVNSIPLPKSTFVSGPLVVLLGEALLSMRSHAQPHGASPAPGQDGAARRWI